MTNNTIGFFQSHNLINTITVIKILEFPGTPMPGNLYKEPEE
ncbi:MAG: hypothetical protein WAM42_20285 [Candidatus Nitrosopolaris sp.]